MISRRAAWALIVAAAWTIYVWSTRIYTLIKQDQTTSFKIAHFILAGISIAFGIAIARIGGKALRRGSA